MPELSRQVRRHYRDQQHISRATARAILAMWRNVDPDNISASWQRQIARAAAVLSAGQNASAQSASTYIATLPRLSAPEYVAAPAAFAGQTAGGGSLAGLLYNPVVTSKLSILQGNRVTDALHIGQSQLGMLVLNEVQQAGRNAAGVGITVFPDIVGYTRVLTPPSCPRCIVLAGKWYRWSSGFKRHIRCDCVHKPDYGSRDRRNRARPTDPQDYFDGLTEDEQDATFGKADAQAIRDGADLSQVVNAYRKGELYTFEVDGVKKRATRAGTSVREGLAGRRMALADRQLLNADGSFNFAADWERATRPRLTVSQIYKDAGGNREKALAMLREYGYADINRGMRRSQKDLLREVRASM